MVVPTARKRGVSRLGLALSLTASLMLVLRELSMGGLTDYYTYWDLDLLNTALPTAQNVTTRSTLTTEPMASRSSNDKENKKKGDKVLITPATASTTASTTATSTPATTNFSAWPDILAQHALSRFYRGEIEASDLPVLSVAPWPYAEQGVGTAECIHLIENSLRESKHLTLSTDLYNFTTTTTTTTTNNHLIWIADTGYGYGWNKWCAELLIRVQQSPYPMPIFIIDFSDRPKLQRCTRVEQVVGTENVRYSTRAATAFRTFDPNKMWVDVGKPFPLQKGSGTNAKEYLHTPLMVRTDIVEHLDHVLRTHANMTIGGPVEELNRTVDVSHFWPSNGRGVGGIHALFRHVVSGTIEELAETHTQVNAFVGLAGIAIRQGRRDVKDEYIAAMLSTKIIVVAQRDTWEDHYRLFEALVSGALVLTDRMLSMPRELVNGTSIVEYSSADDLKQKILYYLEHDVERLAIARAGRESAMTYHRSWHRIEEIVFGRILTTCQTKPGNRCPYIVHARDGRR